MSKIFRLLILGLFLVPSLSFAFPLVFSNENLAVMLHDKPCNEEKVLNLIEKPMQQEYKLASVVFNNEPFKACWANVPDGLAPEPMYFLVDEAGDAGFFPKALFSQDNGKVVPQGTRI